LLDFARKQEPLIQGADVNKLIEDMARLVEKEATQKNIKLVRNYQKDLPRVQTDPPLLRQVVLNLLNNAAYAIGKDGDISISTRQSANNSVELVFSDTGCGIPKEQLDKIFDPFFTTKPPGKGTGLGLSISHSIIVKLGGRITVASEVGCGATFTIHLPVEQSKGE
jgi:signal transduction histidine kinase